MDGVTQGRAAHRPGTDGNIPLIMRSFFFNSFETGIGKLVTVIGSGYWLNNVNEKPGRFVPFGTDKPEPCHIARTNTTRTNTIYLQHKIIRPI